MRWSVYMFAAPAYVLILPTPRGPPTVPVLPGTGLSYAHVEYHGIDIEDGCYRYRVDGTDNKSTN